MDDKIIIETSEYIENPRALFSFEAVAVLKKILAAHARIKERLEAAERVVDAARVAENAMNADLAEWRNPLRDALAAYDVLNGGGDE